MTKIQLDEVRAALGLSSADIRLMAGEMTAQEMRSVKAVLTAVKARIEALAALDAEKGAVCEIIAWYSPVYKSAVSSENKRMLETGDSVDRASIETYTMPLYASPPQAAPSVADRSPTDETPGSPPQSQE